MSKEPLKLGLHGAAGRLGLRIAALAGADPRFCLGVAMVRAGSAAAGQDIGTLAGGAPAGLCASTELAALRACDVVVDVSAPAPGVLLAQTLAAAGGPALVTGVTGWTAAQERGLIEAARHMALLRSGNFSLGVTALVRQVRVAAARLGPGWGVHIHDHHHSGKKDAPSGTALMLAEAVQQGWKSRTRPTILPTGHRPEHDPAPGEIVISSLREGDIVGAHSLRFCGPGETLCWSHEAASRDIFARGALAAAHWLAGQAPGLYGMADVLR